MAVMTAETETQQQGNKKRRVMNSSPLPLLSSSSSSSSSLLVLEDLSDDLLIEILCRVSNHKDLMRCKCICKPWFFLITNPEPYFVACFLRMLSTINKKPQYPWTFIQSSRKFNISSKDSVFQSQGFSFAFLPFYHQAKRFDPVPVHILHTFNDLVLCYLIRGRYSVYYVCNPVTMQWVALPLSPRRSVPIPRQRVRRRLAPKVFLNLICEEQEEEKHQSGSVATCRFKVVQVFRYGSPLELDIFSSETRQWMKHKVLLLPNKPFPVENIREIVTCNRTLFIIADYPDTQIMVLNLNSLITSSRGCRHYYHVIRRPMVDDGPRASTTVAYQGRLRVLQTKVDKDDNDIVPVLYIWELKKDYYNYAVNNNNNNNNDDADSDCEYWNLVHRVSFTYMVVTNCSEWFSENIVKTGLPTDQGGLCILALNYQPDDGNILCLSFNDRIASYNMWNKTLTFHPETVTFHPETAPQVDSPFLQLVLPSRPTTLPELN